MTQTMTKEQILEKHAGGERMTFVYSSEALFAMEEYAQQQLSAEREKAGKLVSSLITVLATEPSEFIEIVIKQTLNEYNGTQTKS